MVHALEEIHRLLRPSGTLIDIHPIRDTLEVHQSGEVLFSEPTPSSFEDVRQAEEALAQVVGRGLFVVDRSGEFDFLTYGSSAAELRDFWARANAYDTRPHDATEVAREAELYARAAETMQAAGGGTEIASHEKARITCLRPVRR